MGKRIKRRHLIQAMGALAINGNLKGFIAGNIYAGDSKQICLPVLNCYSCPGALTSCPIGSLQAVSNHPGFNFSFYVAGLLAVFGILAGRFYCGWLCPFGLLQDLLAKIRKKKIQLKLDRPLRYLKYVILILLVLLLPAILVNQYGIGAPLFCKYICPAGTIQASLPLLLVNSGLRSLVGAIFSWKLLLAILTVVATIFITRAFCRYICPLGAILGIFHPISFYRFGFDATKCIDCGMCAKVCPMGIYPVTEHNSPECIRCRNCINVCPGSAITSSFAGIPITNAKSKAAKRAQDKKTEKA
ncbi:MAG TPA: 4Fe-4S binding protein [Clostridiaceae bacterium]|nr:4Fe-4S binding protein [Clostridiaceae bacterium]